MRLKIVTPERVVFEDAEIEAVYARSVDGEVGVLAQHVPMVTPLAIGVFQYVKGGQKHSAAVMGGVLQTDGKTVTVLTDSGELAAEIDPLRAQHARDRAEARLREKSASVDVNRASLALTRSLTRLKVTGK